MTCTVILAAHRLIEHLTDEVPIGVSRERGELLDARPLDSEVRWGFAQSPDCRRSCAWIQPAE